jgi:hypothetical protein
MHFHLTSSQLLVAAFALTLGIVFALTAVVRIRLQKAPRFRNYWSEYDRNLFPDDSFGEAEDICADQATVLTDFGARYRDSSNRQARAQNTAQHKRD